MAALVLSYGTQDFHCVTWDLFVVACRLSSWGTWAPGHAGLVTAGHRLSRSEVCGILVPDQGLNPGPLHSYANSSPLDHQGSPSL